MRERERVCGCYFTVVEERNLYLESRGDLRSWIQGIVSKKITCDLLLKKKLFNLVGIEISIYYRRILIIYVYFYVFLGVQPFESRSRVILMTTLLVVESPSKKLYHNIK